MNEKIVNIVGGLGNQLFGYAFAGYLELLGYSVRLLTSSYRRDKLRHFKLSAFNISIPVVTGIEAYYFDTRFRLGIKGIADHHIYISTDTFEKVSRDSIDCNNMFWGLFQVGEYVEYNRERLADEIRYLGSLSVEQTSLLERINTTSSVGLHVRRGDYLNSVNRQIFQIVGIDYYRKSIDIIKNRIDDPVFYVFSDDLRWCRECFGNGDNMVYVDDRYEGNDLIDFEMLKACKHFITGNSTYSWWASELSDYKDKTIIAPKHWFYDEKVNLACSSSLLNKRILL